MLASVGEEDGNMPAAAHQDFQKAMIYCPESLETCLNFAADTLGQP
jgi:hypothetical protein